LLAPTRFTRFVSGPLGLIVAGALVVGWALAFPQRSLADPPVFTGVPANVLVEADASGGATINFTKPTAIDDSGHASVYCDWFPGDRFPVGTTTVTCAASDPETYEESEVSFSILVLPHAQERSSSGAVTALLYYTKGKDVLTPLRNVHLTIIRQGKVAFQAAVPYAYPAGYGTQRSIRLLDLDGDSEPEVLLDLYSGGAHCCFSSTVYRYAGASYQTHAHFWGNLPYRLADLNHDRKREFITADDRFAYAFSSFAFSGFPIQIWTYDAGRFSNVTRSYPSLIRADAARMWRDYGSLRRQRYETEGALAAWAADQYLLHHRALVWRRLRESARAGLLTGNYRPTAYLRKLRLFLGRLGYAR
jgi:hypothetical protein